VRGLVHSEIERAAVPVLHVRAVASKQRRAPNEVRTNGA